MSNTTLVNKLLSSLVFLASSVTAFAQTGAPVEYIGTNGNWFEPSNWGSGLVPNSKTDIAINSGQSIVIDSSQVEVNNIYIDNASELILKADSVINFNQLNLISGILVAQSSQVIGMELNTEPGNPFASGGGFGCSHCGIVLGNPSSFELNTVELLGASSFGLGGLNPAGSGVTGPGFYTALIADDVLIDGEFEVQMMYDFRPQVGDEYQIITANNLMAGTFANLPEGSIYSAEQGVDFRITYKGGDGNDVVLTVVRAATRFIGSDQNWFDPNNWDSGSVPDSNSNVVLSGDQTVMIDNSTQPTKSPIIINHLTLNESSLILMENTDFTYNRLLMDEFSDFDVRSSHVSGDISECNTRIGLSSRGYGSSRLNPSTIDNRSIKITGEDCQTTMFIGGTNPASQGQSFISQNGTGHYATMSADEVILNGDLNIESIHGFLPSEGESYQIITARDSLTGQFKNLNEGDVVAKINDLDLVISYQGGDGNDVVLTVIKSTDVIFKNSFDGS